MTAATSDVVIVGGGVIGLSLAWELAGQGCTVTVVEQGDFGREASWAGAGILPPGNLTGAKTPEAKLRAFSAAQWPGWTQRLHQQTGTDNGYRNCGGLLVASREHLDELRAEQARLQSEGVTSSWIETHEFNAFLPASTSSISAALLVPSVCQVRNPRHLKALIAACSEKKVRLLSGTPVIGFERQGDRVLSIRTPVGGIAAGQFCITAGAWTKTVLSWAGLELPIEPVRGQIALLQMSPLPFTRIIEEGRRYLVPRPDGRILIGSTEEKVGFDRGNTAEGVAGLIQFATRLVPKLKEAKVERFWSGFRPGTPNELPFLGGHPSSGNLFIAAGHFRSGLQMSPGTAVLMRQCLMEQPTEIPLAPYSPARMMTKDQ